MGVGDVGEFHRASLASCLVVVMLISNYELYSSPYTPECVDLGKRIDGLLIRRLSSSSLHAIARQMKPLTQAGERRFFGTWGD
jgi:hypothetical protein